MGLVRVFLAKQGVRAGTFEELSGRIIKNLLSLAEYNRSVATFLRLPHD